MPASSSASRRSSPLLCGPMRRVSSTRNPGRRLRRTSRTTLSTFGAEVRVVVAEAPGIEPECGTARLDVAAHGVTCIGGLRDAVVLHDDQQRRAPGRRQVHRFIHQALAQCSIPDDRCHDSITGAQLVRQRHAGADAHHPALHAVAVEVPVGEVLAAAPSTTNTCLASHDLRYQAEEISRVGEEMPVVAVVGENDVVRDRRARVRLPSQSIPGPGRCGSCPTRVRARIDRGSAARSAGSGDRMRTGFQDRGRCGACRGDRARSPEAAGAWFRSSVTDPVQR